MISITLKFSNGFLDDSLYSIISKKLVHLGLNDNSFYKDYDNVDWLCVDICKTDDLLYDALTEYLGNLHSFNAVINNFKQIFKPTIIGHEVVEDGILFTFIKDEIILFIEIDMITFETHSSLFIDNKQKTSYFGEINWTIDNVFKQINSNVI